MCRNIYMGASRAMLGSALLALSLLISTPSFSQDQPATPATTTPAVPYRTIGVIEPTAQEAAALQAQIPPDNGIWLETLDVRNMTSEYREPHVGKSLDWNPLTLNGTVYPHGIGAHAHNQMTIDLKGAAHGYKCGPGNAG